MGLNKVELELFLAFVAKHRRFLKLRETSYNANQLEDGIDVTEKAVKAVALTCKSLNVKTSDCVESPSTRSKLIKILRKKVSRLSPKQAELIIDYFESFTSALSQAQEPKAFHAKTPKKNSEYGDKYYQPVEHKYR